MANNRSREDLLEFLDYAKSKGLMKAATAESRKAAVNQVLGMLVDAEAADVAALDVEHLLDRFQTRHGKRYSPESLRTYRARVRNAIDDFLRYQANPMDFRPKSASAKKVRIVKRAVSDSAKDGTSSSVSPVQRQSMPQIFGTSTLPIPLREDLTVLVHGLPFDLTESEARKISNVVLAMASPTISQG